MIGLSPPYSLIYADPPWSFSTYSARGKGRSADSHYDCLSLDEIKSLPCESLADTNCVLLLWTTDPFLEKAFEVIESWGFVYKTVGFYWVKSNDFMGTGYWTRANPEQCLLATRGHPHRLHSDVRKLVVSPRREHSQKPDEIYPAIERLCSGPYLELFARQHQPGWDSWGLESDSGIGLRRWSSSGPPRQQRSSVNPEDLGI